jgi:hypothetical protein
MFLHKHHNMFYLTTNSIEVEEAVDCQLQDDLCPGRVDWQSDLLWHLIQL